MLTQLAQHIGMERWKETPLKTILGMDWQLSTRREYPTLSQIPLPEDAILIPFCNGFLQTQWFDERQLPTGVLIHSDDQQCNIRILKDAVIHRPIVIHYLSESLERHTQITTKLMVHIEEKAQASIMVVESGTGQYLQLASLQLRLDEYAQCEWISAILNAPSSHSLRHFNAVQAEKSQLRLFNYHSGGQTVRADLDIQVEGEYADTALSGLNLARDAQHSAQVVSLDHKVANCQSNQQFKNIIKDKSLGLFDGKIHVFQDAQKTNAQQLSRSLLLTEKARALTIPRLEIYADDVKCSHGATIGFLAPEHLFYLRSRGLSETMARKMLIQAFAIESIDIIKHPDLHAWLSHQLQEDLALMIES